MMAPLFSAFSLILSCIETEIDTDSTSSTNHDVVLEFSCPAGKEETPLGEIQDTEITETSGIGQSYRQTDRIWIHNDSGDRSLLYAVTNSGTLLGKVDLNIEAVDWEDMSTIQMEDSPPYMYVGDIGDNNQEREEISIHKIREPVHFAEEVFFQTYTLQYPDNPHNAEALVVHPITGVVYIITKDVHSTQIFKVHENEQILEEMNRFTFAEMDMEGSPLVTAADISPDGSTLLIRTYTHIWALDATILEGNELSRSCAMPGPVEEQGEAITFINQDEYISISEGESPTIHRFSIVFE